MAASVAALDVTPGLEARPAKWRVGLIALATDHTSERDFSAMSPSADLAVYVNRVAFANPATPENLRAMAPLLTEAANLILPGEELDAVAYSCTAASALIGDDLVRDAIWNAKPGVSVITPTSAAMDAFAALQVRRISLLTPYTRDVTDALAGYFEDAGLEVLDAHCFGLSDDREMARVSPDTIAATAARVCHPRADAQFVSCTALRAASAVQAIEGQIGRPVVTSNQAMFWQTIRQAGCTLPVAGYGRLLRDH